MLEIASALHEWEQHPNTTYPGESQEAVFFWGDSLMQHLLPRIAEVVHHHTAPRRTVMLHTRSGCLPIVGIERFNQPCAEFTQEGLAQVLATPAIKTVVIAGSWAGLVEETKFYRVGDSTRTGIEGELRENQWVWESFESQVRAIIASGREVVLILMSPNHPAFTPGDMAIREGLGFRVQIPSPVPRSVVAARNVFADQKLAQIAERTGATLLDPKDWLCLAETCSALDEQGRLIYKDTMHVRPSIARERFTVLDRFVYVPAPARTFGSTNTGSSANAR
jgi:SGNH domain (fused to AT3 domains)